jgi:hypothetical protein
MSDTRTASTNTPTPIARTSAPHASQAMTLFVMIVVILYFGKEVLMPVTLALLLGFRAGTDGEPATPRTSRSRAIGAPWSNAGIVRGSGNWRRHRQPDCPIDDGHPTIREDSRNKDCKHS